MIAQAIGTIRVEQMVCDAIAGVCMQRCLMVRTMIWENTGVYEPIYSWSA